MSLTRAEWLEMWRAIKVLDKNNFDKQWQSTVESQKNIQKIKELIQKVIGQME